MWNHILKLMFVQLLFIYFWVDNLMLVQLVTSISGKIQKINKKSLQWNGKNVHTLPEL